MIMLIITIMILIRSSLNGSDWVWPPSGRRLWSRPCGWPLFRLVVDHHDGVAMLYRKIILLFSCCPKFVQYFKLYSFQGRMKFVRPLYRDLYGWEEKRQQAIDTFKAHRLLLSVDKLVVVVVVVVF